VGPSASNGSVTPRVAPPAVENQHAIVGDVQPQVLAQVGDQSVTVGVVAEQRVIGVEDERVDRAGTVGAGRQLVRQLRRGFLVWYGHIQSASAAREELQHLRAKVLGRDVIEPIIDELVRLLGEQPVDERRPAVTDRMTDHTVLIWRAHRGKNA